MHCKTCQRYLSPAEALTHRDEWPGHYVVSADEIENEKESDEHGQ